MALEPNLSTGPALGVLRPDAGDVLPDLDTLCRSLGRRRRPPEAIVKSAELTIAEARALLQPAAVWAEVEAAGLAEALLPGIPAAHLAGVSTLIGVVCTIGEALEAQAQRHFAAQEYTRGYLLDQAGALAVAGLAQHVERLVRAGRNAARWAPGDGEGDWAMESQRMLFALLPADAIGVRLSEHNVMFPAKSLSFVLLVGSSPAGRQCLGSCSRCVWNGACDRRSASEGQGEQ
ncbi:MAG TPA: hypothetical protein PLJ35_02020 [Anaerolineae bacterium]|nr:hypothetical protein [Anaerolineae bacterium]HPL28399.1 hypothetical protein [Anaerolineae bacterium]